MFSPEYQQIFSIPIRDKSLGQEEDRRVGDKIREKREALGLSQSELGVVFFLSQTQVSLIESGKRGLYARELIRVAKVLGCGVGELL